MPRRYKVRDLMIDVKPPRCGNTRYCLWTGCGWNISTCRFTGEFLADDGSPIPMPYLPENLAALKDELRQTLAEVEAQERVMEESMRPQTLEEAEELERKLSEALDDLRTQKEELRRKASEEG